MPRQVFTTSGTFTVPADITEVGVLIVGGGGGGGRAGSAGGGGSGGQVRWEAGVSVTPAQNITVTIGAGGAGRSGTTGSGSDGASSFFGALEAIGGGAGAGGGASSPGQGAYGGGGQSSSSGNYDGGIGMIAYNGGSGAYAPSGTYNANGAGGGGGAGGVGGNGAYIIDTSAQGGAGGSGLNMSAQVGSDVGVSGWFGGGGGGGTQRNAQVSGTGGAGGQGGGGAGRDDAEIVPGGNGTANTGGGGGGGGGSVISGTTDGGNGGSGVVIVIWGEAPPAPLTVTTSELTAPTGRWIKPALRVSWYDGSNWGAILPTTGGHALVPDLNDMTTGTVIDDRQNSRPTAVYHDGWLGVLRSHPSATRFSSFDATDNYTAVVTDAAVPLTAADLDASPIAMCRSANGYLWAAVAESGTVKVSRSTDNGATWGTAQTIITLASSTTGIVTLVATGTTVVLYATENDATGDHRYVRTIAQNAGSYAAGSWTSESLPALPGGTTADDHAAIDVAPDGRVIVVSKTTVNTSAQLLYVLVRGTGGTWTQAAVLENGPDTLGYTRPALTITNTQVYVYYGSFGSPTNLYRRAANLYDLTSWSSRTTIKTGSDWSDSAALPIAAAVTEASSSGTFPVLIHDRTTQDIVLEWVSYANVVANLVSEPFPGFSDDVADGSAIVYDRVKPSDTVVIANNKANGGGLYVLGLDGQIRSSWLPGAANSVDYRDFYGNPTWDNRILIATTDRQSNLLRYAWLDRTAKTLSSAGSTSLGWEPYGSCLYVHTDGKVYMFVTQRGPDDISPRNMYQYELTRSGGTVSGTLVRTIPTDSVVEGLVGDDKRGHIFASEENVGLYRYSGSPAGGSSRVAVDTVGAGNLHDDIEDVALAHLPERDVLLVSSQGDDSYHVYDVDTFEHLQRFTVMRPDGTTQVTGTDGLDILLGYLGPDFPYGLIVVHDGGRTPVSDNLFVDASLVFGEWRNISVTSRAGGNSVARLGISVKGKTPILRAAIRSSGTTIPLQ